MLKHSHHPHESKTKYRHDPGFETEHRTPTHHEHTLITLAVLLLSPLAGLSAAEDAKPNIVYILADDLGYMDIGAFT